MQEHFIGDGGMNARYGNAVRDYATAMSSGRLKANQIDSNYLAACISTITNCDNDQSHANFLITVANR